MTSLVSAGRASEPHFHPVRGLPPEGQLQAARLVQSALPAYFEPIEPARADIVVCRDFGEGGTELEPCLAATKGVEVRGILCTYPMDELAERQYRSVQLVARTLPRDEYARFAANLRDLRSGLPQIEGDGTYLAFIAVGTSEQGSGLAHKLMAEAIEAAGRKPLLLTVRNNNERARAFYTRHRFHLAAEGRDFSLLRRDPTTGH